MRPGTPGFNGDRLREAREARGMSTTALADITGILKQSLSLYEHRKATPHPDQALKIAETLNLPLPFFMDGEPTEDPAPIFNRSMASATKLARLRSRRRYDWLRKVVGFVDKFCDFPQLN